MTDAIKDGGAARAYKFEKLERDGSGVRYSWSVTGQEGGIHIWAQCTERSRLCPLGFYGGVEVHQRHGEGEPHHSHCWLLNGPCWHDGSSLYFEENIAPILNLSGEDGAGISNFLRRELDDWYQSHIAAREVSQ